MHKQFLLKALELAELGRGICSPNPSVGAIAVQNNIIIAQAWHHGAGTLHAEQLLLAEIPKNAEGVTLYVTLEPCNHWGRTPPCVDAIINHGVERVVFAFADPNPIVSSNKTPNLLSEQGIDVLHYPVDEIDEFYNSYKYWFATKKPWVSAKIAQTLDGKIAGSGGGRVNISNSACSKFTHQQRLRTDVILTTAKTVNQDNPLLNARVDGVEYAKHVAIIDSRLELNKDAQIFKVAKCCHIYFDESLSPPQNSENCFFHGVSAEKGQLDLKKIICHLGGIGYHDAWVEAGGGLFNTLHQERLVNKTYIYIAPKVLGEDSITSYRNVDVLNSFAAVSWQIMDDNIVATIDW
ncbi:MAG: bifunctional diaminohydroxyphosphoribosylaminopyrimidine deaminase/5-amino-6-(5-phosphoribosylamino)uracil reductase RibD [Legionellaceae bacterium]|nr:bifunctional diaminohydroxyphosphoribosylaminopyrimidine deaminase/5-amino-6-(5-phosphoribosylamino)uracil reductase RibD [Legionellaceae bacterium]